MSQASEESRAYSSWNRTPGKPQQNKMSTISSSTDSGVGRTPTWGCDTDCGIVGGESNLWGNGCVAPPDLIENNKRGSWDDSDTQENCKTGNLSFGFTSQWNAGSGLPTIGSQISTWATSSTNPAERTTIETSNIETSNCWNLSSRPSDDDYLPRSSSIWSSNPHRQFSDHDSEINTPSTSCAVELNTSMHNYHSNLTTASKNNQNINTTDKDKCDEVEDVSEAQTWAQAAGKGLQTSGSSEDGVPRREIDEQYETIINRVEGWGSHTVDQSTPWNVVEDVDLSNVAVSPETISQRSRSTAESNVWTNEPPNGVGVWESHYEMIGEKTSRWASGASGAVKPKSGWEVSCSENVVSSQWGERECDSSVWNPSPNVMAETRNSKPTWIGGVSQSAKPESSVVGAIGTGSRGIPSNYPLQRNNSAVQSAINISSPPGELNEPVGARQAFFPPQNINMMTNNRSNPNLKIRPMMNLGFRKDDAQGALFNGMDVNRAMNQSSVNQSNMMAQRNDWNMVPDNFCSNPVEIDNCMINGPNNNFMQPPFGGGNSSSMKQQMMQQHMQMAMPSNRLVPSDNQILFEKQIIKEINQLQAKQQDLIQRINGLRSIAGSQAIIQEMTRTLSEVRQQLNTQQATLKVIRSQMVPNGVITNNNNMSLPRPMPPGQSQSSMMSDLSLHMNDMKLQKRNMDLWPQGNLPSPNTISPYVGMDKPSSGMFYNGPGPNNQMNGSMMSQSFNQNGNKPPSQSNYIQSAAHRQSGQMWPSRQSMPGLAPGSQNSTSDYHLSNEDGDSSMGYHTSANAIGDQRNNTSTTALSLSQAPFSSSGNGASTAFTSRDISFASANISEFVPGQPWPGISYSQRDDPNVTLGAGQRSLLSVTNDHLEKLANSNVNSMMTSSDVCANSNILNRLPSNTNGLSSGASITYVLIRDLPSHINIEMLRNVLTPQSFPGLIQMHPNLAARWVLLHFTCNEETLKAFKSLYGKVGVVELVPDQEVNQRLQHNNCAPVGPVLPFSGMVDFHSQHSHQQQQQSHYLH